MPSTFSAEKVLGTYSKPGDHMRVFHDPSDAIKERVPSAVAIGNFDGCHLGHQALLKKMLASAREQSLRATVLTFYPHPVELLNPSKPLQRLMTAQEKLKFLEKMGVDRVLVVNFLPEIAQMSAEDFFQKYLIQTLSAHSIHVGYNFRFGKDRQGDLAFLKGECTKRRVALDVLEPYELSGGPDSRVSSSRIRESIRLGQVAQAKEMLGYPYTLSGTVIHGDNRGEQLGFPTANLAVSTEKVLPPNGVYVTRARWQKQYFKSVTNIGVRPTFGESQQVRPNVEVHFIGVHPKLYQEWVQLEIWDFIRDEKKFPSKEALVEQIQKDVLVANQFSYSGE